VLLVNEDGFFNFKLREKEPTAEELKDMEKEKLEEHKKPIFQQNDLEGSVKKTAAHGVKAIYTKDQKHFLRHPKRQHGRRRGPRYVRS